MKRIVVDTPGGPEQMKLVDVQVGDPGQPVVFCDAFPTQSGRAKFVPARDSNGNATTDTVTTPSIVWRLEGE